MIYPDMSAEEWIKLHPVLEIKKKKCHFCKECRVANIPFIEKDWVGLESKNCPCGRGRAISVSAIRPTSNAYPLLQTWINSLEEKLL